MARRRKELVGLNPQGKVYWEKLLTLEGLSMEKGRSKRLVYVGTGATLESIEGTNRMDDGSSKPEVTE
jgi:hypothetical protein